MCCEWYKKPTEAGTVLSFLSCGAMKYEITIGQGTVQRNLEI